MWGDRDRATQHNPSMIQIELFQNNGRKRLRKGIPLQSLNKSIDKETRAKLKVFQLDVFANLSKKPRILFTTSKYRRHKLNRVISIDGCEGSEVPSIEKSIPQDLSQVNLDLSLFKDTAHAPPLSWKGHPMEIDPNCERYNELTSEEIATCVTVRLIPSHYLYIKDILLRATIRGPAFKKRDAQGWFRIDVNKVPPWSNEQINKLYDWFVSIGWIPSSIENWGQHVKEHVLSRK